MFAHGSSCISPNSFQREFQDLSVNNQYQLENNAKWHHSTVEKETESVSCTALAFFSLQKLCFVYLGSQLKNLKFYIKFICILEGSPFGCHDQSGLCVKFLVHEFAPKMKPFLQMKSSYGDPPNSIRQVVLGQRRSEFQPSVAGRPQAPVWDYPSPHGWHLKTTLSIVVTSCFFFFQLWLIYDLDHCVNMAFLFFSMLVPLRNLQLSKLKTLPQTPRDELIYFSS